MAGFRLKEISGGRRIRPISLDHPGYNAPKGPGAWFCFGACLRNVLGVVEPKAATVGVRKSFYINRRAGAAKALTLGALAAIAGIAFYVASPSAWLSSLWSTKEPWESGSGAKTVVVEVVEARSSSSSSSKRFFSGTVRAKQTSQLSFQRIGRLSNVEVRRGDRVKDGQLLAKLDSRRLKAKLQSLNSQWKQAKAMLAELKAGPRKEDINAQKAAVEDLKAQVQSAQKQSDRRIRLVQSSAVSTEKAEQAKFNLLSVKAKLNAAQQNLNRLLAGTRKEKIEAQTAEVERLAASVKDAEIEIELSSLVAPYNGYITQRNGDEGSVVSPGKTIFEIVEDDRVEAWVGVPSEAVAALKDNASHKLFLGEKPYDCKLKSIVPQLNTQTLTQLAVMELPGYGPQELPPGTVVRLQVVSRNDQSGYWLPITALLRQGEGLWAIYVVSSSGKRQEVSLRDVEVLQTQQDQVFVAGSVKDGDQVVASGTHKLTPGQKILTKDQWRKQEEAKKATKARKKPVSSKKKSRKKSSKKRDGKREKASEGKGKEKGSIDNEVLDENSHDSKSKDSSSRLKKGGRS